MKIGVVSRLDPDCLGVVRRLLDLLSGDILLEEKLAEKIGWKGGKIVNTNLDALICIGGDGTILSSLLRFPQVPILGISLGRMGFLATAEANEVESVVRAFMKGELEIEKRMRLQGIVESKELPPSLNEVAVITKTLGKTCTLSVTIDEKESLMVQGDGIIVATPTGSTGYSLSAGGPIVDPSLECIILTPICPVPPHPSSIVLPPSSTVQVTSKKECVITIDGQLHFELSPNQVLSIRKGPDAKIYRWRDFYKKVKEKLWRL